MNGKKIRTNYECQTVMATGQWQHRKNIKRNNNYIRITFFFIVSIRLLNGKSKGEEKKKQFSELGCSLFLSPNTTIVVQTRTFVICFNDRKVKHSFLWDLKCQ